MYALDLWPALCRYCDDGAIEIDNSAAERACEASSSDDAITCSPPQTRMANRQRPFTR